MIRWLTNRGKCKSLVRKIDEEMQYRMYAMVFHRHETELYNHSWLIWYKLSIWRKEFAR